MAEKIQIRCPHCGGRLQVRREILGKRVKCPKCGKPFQVEEEAPPVSQEAAEREAPARRREAGRDRGRSRSASRGRRARAGEAAARGARKGGKFLLLGLGALAVLAVALVFLLGGGPPSWFTQGMEKAQGTADPRSRAAAYLEVARKAEKGEWGSAREDAARAWALAEKAVSQLKPSRANVDFLLQEAEKAASSAQGTQKAKAFAKKALALVERLPDPAERARLYLDLASRWAPGKAPAWAPLEGKTLLEMAFAAAEKVPGRGAVDLLSQVAQAAGPDLEALRKKCWTRILERDPENQEAHLALGHEKVPQDSPLEEFRGKWLTSSTEKRLYRRRMEDRKAALAAKKKAADKWKKDRFARACKRLAREMEREISEKKWHWFFDDEYVKKPYLLAVEESLSPTTEGIAQEEGQVLSALVTNFYKKYQKLLDLKPPKRPVGVFVFKSKSSYAEFQKKHSKSYPDPRGIGGFFSGERGRMYLWAKDDMQRGGKPMDLTRIMFHEGTHQLMHYNKQTPGPQIGNSPWLQEGIAEFFAGYYTRINPETGRHEYRNGKFLEGRYSVIAPAAARYLETKKVPPGIMPLKDLIYLGYPKFRQYMWGRNRNPFVVAMVYAEGWAFIHFLNHYEKAGKKGYYKKKFEEFLKAEIEGISSPKKFERIFGITSDRQWNLLQDEFFRYLMDSEKGMRKYLWEYRSRKPGYWPPEDQE